MTEGRMQEVGRKAISDEIEALEAVRDRLGEEFSRAAGLLASLEGKVIALGVGKSGHAAAKVAATLRSTGVPALYLSAADSLHGDLGVVSHNDVALLFSKSGGTRELIALVPHLRSRGATIIGVLGTPDSPLGKESDIVLDASVPREGCPLDAAPMASVLAALAIGDALAAAVMSTNEFTAEDFARLHPDGALGARLTLSVADVMRRDSELPQVGTDASLKDAVLEITRTGYGAVCITGADGGLAGFLTDGDVRRALVAADNIAEVMVSELMTKQPLYVTPDLPLSQALLMLEQRPKALMTAPVVDEDNRCVGLLRLHDAVQAHLRP